MAIEEKERYLKPSLLKPMAFKSRNQTYADDNNVLDSHYKSVSLRMREDIGVGSGVIEIEIVL